MESSRSFGAYEVSLSGRSLGFRGGPGLTRWHRPISAKILGTAHVAKFLEMHCDNLQDKNRNPVSG